MEINISEYTYELPDEKIAKFPVEPRDHSRLLLFKDNQIAHYQFYDLVNHLPQNAHLVFNDTKVIPARIFFSRESGAKIEVFLLNPVQPSHIMSIMLESKNEVVWECAIGNKKKWKEDENLSLIWETNNHRLEIQAFWFNRENNQVKFVWNTDHTFSEILDQIGKIPLPPYLNRESRAKDKQDYQTVYSANEGAVAAPTAGLHFTQKILGELSKAGYRQSYLTLHVGAGTFMPVKVNNALEHPMHCEQLEFKRAFIESLLQYPEAVIPVGTTSMRSLESLYWFGHKLVLDQSQEFFIEKLYPYQKQIKVSLEDSLKAILKKMTIENQEVISGNTEIMIFPGYDFKVCKGLITNFHQPGSTLLLLVAALVGNDNWKKIYNEALNKGYRFLSFGDSSLLMKH